MLLTSSEVALILTHDITFCCSKNLQPLLNKVYEVLQKNKSMSKLFAFAAGSFLASYFMLFQNTKNVAFDSAVSVRSSIQEAKQYVQSLVNQIESYQNNAKDLNQKLSQKEQESQQLKSLNEALMKKTEELSNIREILEGRIMNLEQELDMKKVKDE